MKSEKKTDRSALAAAIFGRKTSEADLAKAEEAVRRGEAAFSEAVARKEAAEKAADEAADTACDAFISALERGVAVPVLPPTRAAVADAERHLEAVRGALLRLRSQVDERRAAVAAAQNAVTDEVGRLVAPRVAHEVENLRELQRDFENRRARLMRVRSRLDFKSDEYRAAHLYLSEASFVAERSGNAGALPSAVEADAAFAALANDAEGALPI